MGYLSRMTEDNSEQELRIYLPVVQKILSLENNYRSLSDSDLFSTTKRLKELIKNGISREEILPHAFAACREATYRKTGKMQYPSQILAAVAMENDAVSEMMTGQGKSLVIPLKAYLDSLYGKVNIVTSNDYLAERDSFEAKKIFDALGIKTSHISSKFSRNDKKLAYQNDIIYSTVQQLGFDYLRDNLQKSSNDKIMSELDSIIIDEMDSILFDQGMTPLVLSGEEMPLNIEYLQKAKLLADKLVAPLEKQLNTDRKSIKRIDSDLSEAYDSLVDFYFSKDNQPIVTESGIEKIEAFFNVSSSNIAESTKWVEIYNYVINALTARDLQKDDRYIVQNGKIVLIDKTTDRKLLNNNFSYGLHQALEAKEGLNITPIKNTDSSITISSFIKKFKKISGTSGTAYSEYDEFVTQYGKSVVKIPHYMDIPASLFNNKKIKLPINKFKSRTDLPTTICRTQDDKYCAIIEQVIQCNYFGQPILIGTTSIEESQIINDAIINIQKSLNNLYLEFQKNFKIDNNFLSKPLNPEQKDFIANYFSKSDNKFVLRAAKVIARDSLCLKDVFKICHANTNLLNAKNDKIESFIIANAGKLNSITISTNMAGRGTDIPLGGSTNPEIVGMNNAMKIIKQKIKNQKVIDLCLTKDYNQLKDPRLVKIKKIIENTINDYIESAKKNLNVKVLEQQVAIEKQKVLETGGLCVIGSSYHTSRRINDQLRGRAGRQTDKGKSVFYVSLEDDILLNINPEEVERAKKFMIGHYQKETINKDFLALFEKAQTICESNASKQRQDSAQYDSYIDVIRTGFYKERDAVLNNNININEIIENMISKIVSYEIDNAIESNQTNETIKYFSNIANYDVSYDKVYNKEELINDICKSLVSQINDFDNEFNLYSGKNDAANEFKRNLLINLMDQSFQNFMNNDVNDIFQQIGLLNTGGGNKDPKVEFAIMLSQEYEKMTIQTRKELIEKLIKSTKNYYNKNERLNKHQK